MLVALSPDGATTREWAHRARNAVSRRKDTRLHRGDNDKRPRVQVLRGPRGPVHGDEGAFGKWMRFELETIHSGLVTQRRALADLLREPAPTAPARNGAHAFDLRELGRLAATLPTELRFQVRLPMQVYVDSEVADSLYVLDRHGAEALGALGYVLGAPDAQGRRWFGRAVGLAMLRDWPTSVQFVYL